VETWVQTQVSPVDICGVQSDCRTNVSIFPLMLTFCSSSTGFYHKDKRANSSNLSIYPLSSGNRGHLGEREGGEWVRYVSVVIAEIASNVISPGKNSDYRSQWPHGLRRVCVHSLAGVVGSNPAGGTDVLCFARVVRKRSPRLADHSSRGALPTVVCLE
jgi:hypothetical protein